MRKIPTLFQRNYETDRLARDEVTPGCEWVLDGYGIPTRKWDGTSCLYRDGVLYRRYDAKVGRTPPAGFEPAQEEADSVTGHLPGWLPVGDGPEDRWHREAMEGDSGALITGTYELIGPKIQGNPEKRERHMLVPHGAFILLDVPRTFEGLRAYLEVEDIEGIVWWQNLMDRDCPKVKLKKKDFGFKR